MSLNIKIDDTEIKKSFSNLERGVKNFRKPLNNLGDDLVEEYGKRVFQTQGGSSGESWKPLSAATLMMRSKKQGHYAKSGGGSKILVWTGNLQRGFKKAVTKVKLVVDNGVDYFKYHQERGGKTPQRRMMYVNKEIILKAQVRIMDHIKRSMK